jgi:prefoldin subunit 5
VTDTPADLAVRILQDIRAELREIKEQSHAFQQQQQTFQQQQQTFHQQSSAFQEHALARFEVIETALRDMAEQLVILGRGVKVAIENRGKTDARLDDHDRRIGELERRTTT